MVDFQTDSSQAGLKLKKRQVLKRVSTVSVAALFIFFLIDGQNNNVLGKAGQNEIGEESGGFSLTEDICDWCCDEDPCVGVCEELDCDDDGWSNGEECACGSDPCDSGSLCIDCDWWCDNDPCEHMGGYEEEDCDEDGLTNEVECGCGSDPCDPDSWCIDCDWWCDSGDPCNHLDGYEDEDCDDDGWSNAEECNCGSDPCDDSLLCLDCEWWCDNAPCGYLDEYGDEDCDEDGWTNELECDCGSDPCDVDSLCVDCNWWCENAPCEYLDEYGGEDCDGDGWTNEEECNCGCDPCDEGSVCIECGWWCGNAPCEYLDQYGGEDCDDDGWTNAEECSCGSDPCDPSWTCFDCEWWCELSDPCAHLNGYEYEDCDYDGWNNVDECLCGSDPCYNFSNCYCNEWCDFLYFDADILVSCGNVEASAELSGVEQTDYTELYLYIFLTDPFGELVDVQYIQETNVSEISLEFEFEPAMPGEYTAETEAFYYVRRLGMWDYYDCECRGAAFDTASTECTGELAGWWRLDERNGAEAFDYSGAGNTGILHHNPKRVKGLLGTAIRFNGINQHIEIQDSPSLDMTDVISLEAWIMPYEVYDGGYMIIGKSNAYFLWIDDGFLRFEIYDGLYDPWPWKGVRARIASGCPHHAAGVYDGQKLSLYLDGIQVDEKVCTVQINSNSNNVYIGDCKYWNRHFKGIIDDVRAYNFALTPELISSHAALLSAHLPCDDGSGDTVHDISGNGFNGKLKNGARWENSSIICDGFDDRIEIDSGYQLDFLGEMTVMLNLKAYAWPDDLVFAMTKGTGASAPGGISEFPVWSIIARRHQDGKVCFAFWEDGGTVLGEPLELNKDYHIAATYDGCTTKLYVNGLLKDCRNWAGEVYISTEPVWAGCGYYDGRAVCHFNGSISDIRLYNRALSDAEIYETGYAEGESCIFINEALYDETGDDTGYEWIELINLSPAAADISGYEIQAGGASFSWGIQLPSGSVIPPGGYFLIGESGVRDVNGFAPDHKAALSLYNGLSRTDGIRLVNPEGQAEDTLLYSYPNVNNLPGDDCIPACDYEIVHPAAPPQSGSSLSRLRPGFDSDRASDWEILSAELRSPLSSHHLCSGLWRFNECSGGSAFDSSGHKNHGALKGSAAWTEGRIGSAVYFDGDKDYIVFPDSDTLDFQGMMTIEAMVYADGPQGNQTAIAAKGGQVRGEFPSWSFFFTDHGGGPSFCFGEDDGLVKAPFSLEPYQWHHLAATYDGQKTVLYVNGEEVDRHEGEVEAENTDWPMYIGSGFWYDSPTCFFKGAIDEVRLYNDALDSESIAARAQSLELWLRFDENSGKYAADASGNGLPGKLIGDPSWTEGRLNRALEFKSSPVQDYVEVPYSGNLQCLGQMTVEAHIFLYEQQGDQISAASKGGRVDGEFSDWNLFAVDHGGGPSFCFGEDHGLVKAPFVLQRGKWHHLAAVCDGRQTILYVNGNEVDRNVLPVPPENSTWPLYVGCGFWNDGPTGWFNGKIDDFKYYSLALDADNIKKHADCLAGHWPLNDGSGSVAHDRSGN